MTTVHTNTAAATKLTKSQLITVIEGLRAELETARLLKAQAEAQLTAATPADSTTTPAVATTRPTSYAEAMAQAAAIAKRTGRTVRVQWPLQ